MVKIIDRFLLFLYALIITAVSILIALSMTRLISIDRVQDFVAEVFYNKFGFIQNCVFIGLLVVFFISLRLLYISVRRPNEQQVSIDQRTSIGDIKISHDTIENLSLKAANRSRGVHDLRAKVTVSENGIHIWLRMVVDGESSIPELTEEIQKNVKHHIEETAGIPVSNVSVYVTNILPSVTTFKSRVE